MDLVVRKEYHVKFVSGLTIIELADPFERTCRPMAVLEPNGSWVAYSRGDFDKGQLLRDDDGFSRRFELAGDCHEAMLEGFDESVWEWQSEVDNGEDKA